LGSIFVLGQRLVFFKEEVSLSCCELDEIEALRVPVLITPSESCKRCQTLTDRRALEVTHSTGHFQVSRLLHLLLMIRLSPPALYTCFIRPNVISLSFTALESAASSYTFTDLGYAVRRQVNMNPSLGLLKRNAADEHDRHGPLLEVTLHALQHSSSCRVSPSLPVNGTRDFFHWSRADMSLPVDSQLTFNPATFPLITHSYVRKHDGDCL
jgi:hypothetical protein